MTLRLVEKCVPFFDPMKKNNSNTFGTLYKTTVVTKQKETKITCIKADRKLIQQLLNASAAGRKVKMQKVPPHELSQAPLSLAKIDGHMNSTSKSDLFSILSKDLGVRTPSETPPLVEGRTCVVIDGHALIQSMGNPCNCQTFGDYTGVFFKGVTKHCIGSVNRVNVAFDRYLEESIKASTRRKTMGKNVLFARTLIS